MGWKVKGHLLCDIKMVCLINPFLAIIQPHNSEREADFTFGWMIGWKMQRLHGFSLPLGWTCVCEVSVSLDFCSLDAATSIFEALWYCHDYNLAAILIKHHQPSKYTRNWLGWITAPLCFYSPYICISLFTFFFPIKFFFFFFSSA